MKQHQWINVRIFTDGSSLGNPGPGGWGSVSVFRTTTGSTLSGGDTVIEQGGEAERKTTNNRMELTAIIKTLQWLQRESGTVQSVSLYSDSRYAIDGITKWVHNWVKHDWKTKNKTDVLNKDLWQQLVSLTEEFPYPITWEHIEGHIGVPGNERADRIATSFAAGDTPMLYHDLYETYPYGDLNITAATGATQKKRGAAYSYLSLVDGVLGRHQTWAACKARVSGKHGAQFRKAMTRAEEEEILKKWGIR